MTDASSTPPPAYQPTPPPQPSAFPPMPRNPGAAMGMASGFFGTTNPSMLVTFAVALLFLTALLSFIMSFVGALWLVKIMMLFITICGGLGTICLLVGCVRFLSDAWRARP